ncbi:TonB-dependent receptor [Brevundimonas sp. SORGH_AS_0993]|uniref:TonB-dependent receptor n=1 Tax=Brevundimonas sp. SORGH_AS_0993 TaxID=3041794 RepID=UPI0027872AB2|nr:TonB-dependent receptor [Brevundimonas sp. SORGH_AS_0993]MDQ1153422.1 iron complex outermembrane receptor protein [Brevundimonas sp. SORGH_AS_0993]
MTFTTRKALLGCGAAIMALGLATQALAQQRTFDIPAQDAATAIGQYGLQAGVQITAPTDQLRGVKTRPLQGAMDARQALSRLLQGTGLEIASDNGSVIVLRRAAGPQGQAALTGGATQVEEVVVTGTRIRGGEVASPRITISEKQFNEEGFTDLGEVIRSIPQNFRGGQNPGVIGALAGGLNADYTGASSLNLRGLGADASLTLLNGRRLAYNGTGQAIDISFIPIAAVARLDIVPDGASAIYGSDAVGGVANVVLKRDFQGLTIDALYGEATQGGLVRHDYSATGGTTWGSGGVMATYYNSDRSGIFADQRHVTQSQYDPNLIYNPSETQSALISLHQALPMGFEFKLDAAKTDRDLKTVFTSSSTGSPYYREARKDEATLIAPSLSVALPQDWLATLGATWSENHYRYEQTPYVLGVAGTAVTGRYFNDSRTWDLGAEGPLLKLGQYNLRLAVGGGQRTDEFNTDTIHGRQGSRFAYAEFSLPVVGAENSRPGLRRLAFTAAGRFEDYDTYGDVTTPRLGVLYDPSADFTLKATWGRSFKMGTLVQQNLDKYTYLYTAAQLGCTTCASGSLVLASRNGSAEPLEPERARTWTASVGYHPAALPGLTVDLSYFDIDYADRIAVPIPVISRALSDTTYAPYVTWNPTAAQTADKLAYGVFVNRAGVAYDGARRFRAV